MNQMKIPFNAYGKAIVMSIADAIWQESLALGFEIRRSVLLCFQSAGFVSLQPYDASHDEIVEIGVALIERGDISIRDIVDEFSHTWPGFNDFESIQRLHDISRCRTNP
jgi:hypothetical protein